MAKRYGFTVTDTIVTGDSRDEFPVADVNDLKGGYRSVVTKADMNAIPEKRRTLGMLVYVTSEKRTYRYEINSDGLKAFVRVATDSKSSDSDTPVQIPKDYVKSINGMIPNENGEVQLTSITNADNAQNAVNAQNATKAQKDASGNIITETYATKSYVTQVIANIPTNSGGNTSGSTYTPPSTSTSARKALYANVSEMKADTALQNGDIVQTMSYAVEGDDGGAIYKIGSSSNAWDIPLNNGLHATIINRDRVTYSMFGAKLDGVTDDNLAITYAHLYGNKYNVRVENHHGTIYRKSKDWITVMYDVDLSGSVLLMDDSNTQFYSWYCIGNNLDSSTSINHPVSLSSEAKAQLKEGCAYISPSLLNLPPNVVLKLQEDPFMYRDDYGDGYAVDRVDLMVHGDRGIFAGPLVWDWTAAGGRSVSSGYGQSTSSNTFTVTYNALPEHHLVFRGCEVHIKCSPNTQVGLCQILRHRVTIKDFTIVPDAATMTNTNFKAALFYGHSCYDVTFENIQGMNQAGRDTSGGGGHSGYLIDVNGGMDIKIRDCRIIGFWGGTCLDNVKDVHFDRCEMNRIDVHSYFRDMFINDCILYTHGIQIGFGTGICSVHNCSFIFQKNEEQRHANGVISLNNSYGNFFRGLLNVDGIHVNAQPDGSPVVLFFSEFLSNAGCCDPSLKTIMPEIRARNVYAHITETDQHLTLFSFYGTPSGDRKVYNPHLMTFDNIISNQGIVDYVWLNSVKNCTTLNQDVKGSLATFQNIIGLRGTSSWCGNTKPTIKILDGSSSSSGSSSMTVPDNVATKDDVQNVWNTVNELKTAITVVKAQVDSGVYYVSADAASDMPNSSAGYLINLPKSNSDGTTTAAQLFIPDGTTNTLYERVKNGRDAWNSWSQFSQ